MIRILAKNDYLNVLQCRCIESVEDLVAWWKYLFAFLVLGIELLSQLQKASY